MKLQVYDAAPSAESAPRPARVVEAEELKGWLPIDAQVCGGEPYVLWMDMRGVPLSEPFFHQTVERVRAERPARAELLTDIGALIALEKISDSLRPTGFIFHASRCGSTLVSNACGAVRDTLVFSEPSAVDKLLGHFLTKAGGAEFEARLWQIFLRAAVGALGQRRGAGARGLVIKFACCGTLQLGLVKKLWPEVPRVFVYRDPLEIMVSNLYNVPDWMRVAEQPEHTAAVVGVGPREVTRMGPEEFCARALGKFYDAAAEHADARTMLLAYEHISAETLAGVVRFFGAAPRPAEIEEIERVSRLYSKDPARRRAFGGDDGDAKRSGATPLIREMAERWAREPYERLRRKHESDFGF
ncbi:MAG TPA: hypothetical protein VE360_09060 [Pyrinomonadaceae bacterium]|nr:hypothetical protein [Pyrinomonadaceae bacterium]